MWGEGVGHEWGTVHIVEKLDYRLLAESAAPLGYAAEERSMEECSKRAQGVETLFPVCLM